MDEKCREYRECRRYPASRKAIVGSNLWQHLSSTWGHYSHLEVILSLELVQRLPDISTIRRLPTIWEREEDMARKEKGEKEKKSRKTEDIELKDLKTIVEIEENEGDNPAILEVKTENKTTESEDTCKDPENAVCKKKRSIKLHGAYLSYFQGQQPNPEARSFITEVQKAEERRVRAATCVTYKFRLGVGLLLFMLVLWILTLGYLVANSGDIPGPCMCNYTKNTSKEAVIVENNDVDYRSDDRIIIDLDLKDDRDDEDYEVEAGVIIRLPRREETPDREPDEDLDRDHQTSTTATASTTADPLYILWVQSQQSQNKRAG